MISETDRLRRYVLSTRVLYTLLYLSYTLINFDWEYMATTRLIYLSGNLIIDIFTRFSIWMVYKFYPDKRLLSNFYLTTSAWRCYPGLFQARHTWWLVAVVIALNDIDWVAVRILNVSMISHVIFPLEFSSNN